MSDIRQAINTELEALERELQADPRFLKLQHLKELQSLYSAGQPVPAASIEKQAPAAPKPKRTGSRRINPDRERALAAAQEFLQGKVTPIKTAEILELIEMLGIPVGGTVPLSNLSAMLHHSPLFHSHGRKGWTLVESTVADVENSDRASENHNASDNVTNDENWGEFA